MTQSRSDVANALANLLALLQKDDASSGFFTTRLQQHFGADFKQLSIVSASFDLYELPSIHLALQHCLSTPPRVMEIVGISTNKDSLSFSELLSDAHFGKNSEYLGEGPVLYHSVQISDQQTLLCVRRGLFLLREKDEAVAILLETDIEYRDRVSIELMGLDRGTMEKLLDEVKQSMIEQSIYKGQILSLSSNKDVVVVNSHSLPNTLREDVILPDGVLERIERNTLHFSQHRSALLARGLHLKRGILFYGAPGTGKSLLITYLIGNMPGRTTILLNGRSLGSLPSACKLARQLQPSTIVIEDVDLIAEERTRKQSNTLLVELLNEMDGLEPDTDILFLLTTNRPEVLEPALASRPGRIDQAIKIPLPDECCRQRLFNLYARNIDVNVSDLQKVIKKTSGTCAAFMRELLRKATLYAIQEGNERSVEEAHIEAALTELLSADGISSKNLLGFKPNNSA